MELSHGRVQRLHESDGEIHRLSRAAAAEEALPVYRSDLIIHRSVNEMPPHQSRQLMSSACSPESLICWTSAKSFKHQRHFEAEFVTRETNH